MRASLFILCIGIVFFSCSPKSEQTDGEKLGYGTEGSSPGEELYDLELIFEEDSGLVPLDKYSDCDIDKFSSACKNHIRSVRTEVITNIKKVDNSIEVDSSQVRVYYDVAVYLKELNRAQRDIILDSLNFLHAYINPNSFDLFLSKPIMQSEEYIEHAQKPMMQTQFNYDVVKKRSLLIELIGGGDPTFTPVADRRVWILDSGIDNTHQDLSSSDFAFSEDFTASSSTQKNPFDDNIGHGTYIAGIIGGKASNDPIYQDGYGINGVVPGIAMASIKIFKDKNIDKPKAKSAVILEALEYVLENSQEGDVVNISWGIELDDAEECGVGKTKEIMEYLTGIANNGVFIVISAGNSEGKSVKTFPSCLNHANIVTIGSNKVVATNVYSYSWFSNYGIPSIDYLTPGEEIFTTAPGGKYSLVSGTSFSAAIFSGIIYNGHSAVGVLGRIRRGADGSGEDPLYDIAELK